MEYSFIKIPLIGPPKGVPNVLIARNNKSVRIDPHLLLSPEDAVWIIEAQGGRLTLLSPFAKIHLRVIHN